MHHRVGGTSSSWAVNSPCSFCPFNEICIHFRLSWEGPECVRVCVCVVCLCDMCIMVCVVCVWCVMCVRVWCEVCSVYACVVCIGCAFVTWCSG